MEAIAFFPEITFQAEIQRKIRLAPGLFLLPKDNEYVKGLRNCLEDKGYTLEQGGIFLYFSGELKEDGTLYEVFQSYAHALTFYYEGRATCRVTQEICGKTFIKPQLFIDEQDQFGVTSEDKRTLLKKDVKEIEAFYSKIQAQLVSRAFNTLINSLEYFGMYLKEAKPKTRLLFLNICLESLILGEQENEGVGFKLAMRCSHLLHSHDKSINKSSIFEQVNTAYNLRSKIIHGANYEKAKNNANKNKVPSFESDHIDEMEKILKRIYKIVLGKEKCYQAAVAGTLGKELDRLILN